MSYLLEKFKMKGKVMEICDRYARNIIASLSTVAHTGNYNDLTNKPTIPSAQVNSDWNANTGVAEILNKPNLSTVATSGSYNDLIDKPTIPTGQVNSDWNATSGVAEILNKPSLATVATSGSYNDLSNKPSLATVATSGSYNDLSNKPTIPSAQVNSNWNSTSGVSQILNKPSLATVATSGSYNDLSNKPTIPNVSNIVKVETFYTGLTTVNASSSASCTGTMTTPSGYSFGGIMSVTFAYTSGVSGYSNCFIYEFNRSGNTLTVNVRNVSSSQVKVRYAFYVLFIKNF